MGFPSGRIWFTNCSNFTLGSSTPGLVFRNGKLQGSVYRGDSCSFHSDNATERKLIPKGNPLKVFPETRHLRKHNFAIPLLQRAEQGVGISVPPFGGALNLFVQANFLRTYYPDIDVPTELIRDEIIQDAHAIRALETFDPYTGNMLEILCHSGTQDNSAFLAFPMGDSFRELSQSCPS